MKIGAIVVSSIELINQVLKANKKTKFEIKIFFRKNKFAGSKDKKNIKELVFKFLKNYFTLKKICKNNLILFSHRNALLLYYFSKNKERKLQDIYDGRYSLKPNEDDTKIYEAAISLNNEILPTLPQWLEKKLSKDFKKKIRRKLFIYIGRTKV